MISGVRSLMLPIVAMASAVAVSACGHEPVTPPPAASNRLAAAAATFGSGQTRVAGEYLVTLAPGTDVKAIEDAYGRFGIKAIKGVGNGIFQLTLSEDPGPEKMEELRSQDPRIRAIQPNFIYRAKQPAGGRR